jgi:hypothetical protein
VSSESAYCASDPSRTRAYEVVVYDAPLPARGDGPLTKAERKFLTLQEQPAHYALWDWGSCPVDAAPRREGGCAVTCIIAHRDGWVVADRRVVCNDQLLGPYAVSKVQRGPGLLVATAGDDQVRARIERALKGAHTIDALRRIQDVFLDAPRAGHALVLLDGNRGMYEVTSAGAVLRISERAPCWAIGSGYMAAIGYLSGVGQTRTITPEVAAEALALCSMLVNDVGDGYQVEHLDAVEGG